MSDDVLTKRLDRFEDKLDKLAEAVLTIARVEERQAQHARTMERMWAAMESVSHRVSSIENKVSERGGRMAVWERILWALFLAAVGGASVLG